jgi:hypothetical protein
MAQAKIYTYCLYMFLKTIHSKQINEIRHKKIKIQLACWTIIDAQLLIGDKKDITVFLGS